MAVWKFGCNWEANPNSFYDMIKNDGIVIGRASQTPYEKGDLVLITEGFKVKAIAQVDSDPRPITDYEKYAYVQKKYSIKFDKKTTVSKALWYELPPDQRYEYRCQRGAVRVRNKAVLDRTWNLLDIK